MPPRRKVGKHNDVNDTYRWALPGGDEVSALGTGFSRMQTVRALRGVRSMKTLANERLLMAQNQWYLGDRFGILIPTDEKTITRDYLDDLQAAQTRHQDGLEAQADVLGIKRPKSRVLADGSEGQLGRIYKHLGSRTSRDVLAPSNWQDGAVTLREGGRDPLLLLHKPVPGGSFFAGPRIPSPLKKLR